VQRNDVTRKIKVGLSNIGTQIRTFYVKGKKVKGDEVGGEEGRGRWGVNIGNSRRD